jgi:hypothetical protein
MFTRSLLILLAAAVTLGSADAAHAAYGKRFLVYVKGSQETSYEKPSQVHHSNACNSFSSSISASEAISFHSKQPAKVRLITSPVLSLAQTPGHEGGLPLAVSITRKSRTTTTTTSTGCGAPSGTVTHGGTDCGTRKPKRVATFGGQRKISLFVTPPLLAPLVKEGFDDCTVPAPYAQKGFSPVTGDLTEITATVSMKALARLKPGKRLVINANKAFASSPGNHITSKQRVNWQIRLLRLK